MGDGEVPAVDVEGLYAHRLALIRLAALLIDDVTEAEDVVQDAYVGLFRRQHAVTDTAGLAYLRTTVVNGCRSILRKRRTSRKHLAALTSPDAPPADGEAMLAAEHGEVLAALRQLPAGQREVLVLRYWSELSEAEIADTLGISRGAVKSQASRGIDRLTTLLEGDR